MVIKLNSLVIRPFLKNFCIILIFIFNLSVSAILSNPSGLIELNREPQKQCKSPLFLHPDAQELTERFSYGEISATKYLEQFVWLEPEYENYALCIICSSDGPELSPFEPSYPEICGNNPLSSPTLIASLLK